MSEFSSEFFAGNRERLRELFMGIAPIVMAANGRVQKGSDEAYEFHQDRSFWYFTGVDEPDVLLVMDKDKEYLIVPDREAVRETFEGAVNFASLKNRSGVSKVYGEKEGWRHLTSRIRKVKNVATLAAPPRYVDLWGMYTNPARADLIHRLKQINAGLELLDLRPHVGRLRMVKQPPEIAAIQKAIDITVATITEVTKPAKLTKYQYEYEIEADLARGFRRRGATGHAFDPIVASGPRACTIHHIANNGKLASDELVLLDIGADYAHYAADISRTFCVSGKMSHRQQAVYDAVQEAQAYAFSLLKPGVLMKKYEKQVETFVGEKLRELGLIKTIESETVRKFFPHATSHFLGLDTHDMGDYERPLESGVVLAVEPGIYIPDEGIGVRIEDDVLITETGIQILSENLPR